MPQQYLDANGNPTQAPAKVYLDPSTGQPQGNTSASASTTGPTPNILSQLGDWWDKKTAPVTTIQPHNMSNLLGTNDSAPTASQVGHELIKGVGNIGAGGLGVLLHPLDTLKAMGKFAVDASPAGSVVSDVTGRPNAVDDMARQAIHQPLETIESGIGQAGALPILEGAAKVPIKAVRAIPKVARAGADIIAGTGTGAAEGLANKTQAANAAAQTDADAANSKILSARAKQLQQHFEQTQAARQVPTPNLPPDTGLPPDTPKVRTPQELQSQKVAIGRGVEQQAPQFQEDLRTTEKKVRAQAGANYDEVRAATAGETIPSASLADAVHGAEKLIEGSNENLKVFRDILSKAPEGDDFVKSGGVKFGPGTNLYESVKASPEGIPGASTPATFSDLQGYYTELGSQLSKGNLPADVYRATKTLQGSIGDLMQQMAENKGVGDLLTKARSFYSDYMDAFRDSKSPLYKAMNAAEPEGAVKAFKNASSSGVEVLGRYNSNLAQQANRLRNYNAQAAAIQPGTSPKAPSPLPAPKPPVLADVKKIGLQDIQEAKADALQNRADLLKHKAVLFTSGIGAYWFLRELMHGSLSGTVAVGTEMASPYLLGKALEQPSITKWLTNPTPSDIAAIPPELRADMPQIVKAAQAKGIAVHPAILSLAGVTQRAQ